MESNVEPLHQICVNCGEEFDFPEMCSVTECPYCGECNTPD